MCKQFNFDVISCLLDLNLETVRKHVASLISLTLYSILKMRSMTETRVIRTPKPTFQAAPFSLEENP